MRGGIADWRRATAILDGLDQAEPRFRRRCATARAVTAFLAAHPLVEEVYHPTADMRDSQERSYLPVRAA